MSTKPRATSPFFRCGRRPRFVSKRLNTGSKHYYVIRLRSLYPAHPLGCVSLRGVTNRFKVGDRVVAFVGVGGFATDITAKEKSVAPLPPGMDYVTASSFLVAYGTADYALRVRERNREEARGTEGRVGVRGEEAMGEKISGRRKSARK